MMVMARWISSGLYAASEGQIYANSSTESNVLFKEVTIESAACISHAIQAYDMETKIDEDRNLRRVYFYDPLAERLGFTSGQRWYIDDKHTTLTGLDLRTETRRRVKRRARTTCGGPSRRGRRI